MNNGSDKLQQYDLKDKDVTMWSIICRYTLFRKCRNHYNFINRNPLMS